MKGKAEAPTAGGVAVDRRRFPYFSLKVRYEYDCMNGYFPSFAQTKVGSFVPQSFRQEKEESASDDSGHWEEGSRRRESRRSQ